MKRLGSSAVSLGFLLLFTACEGSDSDPARDEAVGEVAQPIAPDPSIDTMVEPCIDEQSWNGTVARLYYPPNGGCNQSVYSPLVLIQHAKGYTYDDYDYLQRHLAQYGFISASVDVGESAPNIAAGITLDYLEDYLWTQWPMRFYIDPSSVALVGHSRGGAASRYLAHSLEAHPIFSVKSVVALAPASQGPNLDGGQTKGYLHIYGTADGDTDPGASYAHHDRAGDDGSQLDPTLNGDVLYKSVKLLINGVHSAYADVSPHGFGAAQANAVKGYVVAFLSAHNKNDVTWYEDYIRGEEVPGAYGSPVYTTYSDGFYRRVIDNFDDGFVANTTIGGEMATSRATAQVLDAGYPHDTHALWMWGSSTSGLVTWTIPAGKRDASAFEWLSLRIAQLSGAPAQDLAIQIRNGTTWSPEVKLSDHGLIAQAEEMCWGQAGYPCAANELVTVNHMATIRVPLAALGPHDDVQHVRLRFRGDSVVDTFLVDNLEFSEWILKP